MIEMTLTEPFPFFDFDRPSDYLKGVAGTVEIPPGTHELERRITPKGHRTPWLFLAGTQMGMTPTALIDFAQGKDPIVTLRERVWVLSLWQPWATLWAIGAKRIETRGWPTELRGPIAVHATRSVPREWRGVADDLAASDPVQQALRDYGRDTLAAWGEPFPAGKILGTTNILDCRSTDARSDWEVMGVKLPLPPGPHTLEYAVGNYGPGRWMWLTGGAQPFQTPVPATGHQKLWKWECDLAAGLTT